MNKETIIILGSLLAIAVVVFLLIIPAIDELSMTRSGLNQQEARIAELKEIAVKIAELNDKYQKNIEEVEKLVNVLPQEQELASLLIQLEKLASANGLVMESIDFTEVKSKVSITSPRFTSGSEEILPKKSETEENLIQEESQPALSTTAKSYRTLLVNLKLTGSYNSFKNYLMAVEKNLRLMDVTSFTFSSQAGGETIGSFSFDVKINVYYQ